MNLTALQTAKVFAIVSKYMFISSFIALRYIKSKRHSFLPSLSFATSFFGIFLSVFTLIVTICVMDGFKEEFKNNIIGIRPHMKIYFLNDAGKPSLIPDYKSEVRKIKGDDILFASEGIGGEGMVTIKGGAKLQGVVISGITESGFLNRSLISKSIISGALNNFDEEEDIIIGSELAFLMGVAVGDVINLVSPKTRSTPFGSIPIHKTFKVSAIFKVGIYFYDSAFVFIPFKMAEKFFDQEGANFIEVMVKNPNNLSIAKMEIGESLQRRIFISDWQTENKSFIDAINLQKSVMFFILLMFLILASFIVFSSLSALIVQKNKTTAILKTIGLSSFQSILIFIQVGMFAVIPAVFLGSVLGSIFVIKLEAIKNWLEGVTGSKIFDGAYYFLSYIPSKLEPMVIVQIVCISLVASLFAIILPSLKILKTKPIDALKWE